MYFEPTPPIEIPPPLGPLGFPNNVYAATSCSRQHFHISISRIIHSENLINSGYNDFQMRFMKNINNRYKSTNDWPVELVLVVKSCSSCIFVSRQSVKTSFSCATALWGFFEGGVGVIFLNYATGQDIMISRYFWYLQQAGISEGFFLPWLWVILLIFATGQDIRGFFLPNGGFQNGCIISYDENL